MNGTEHLYTTVLMAACGFLLLVAVIRHYAPRTPLPAESWLLLAGVGYGLMTPRVAGLPVVRLNPEVVMSMLLPVLVFSAGRRLPVTMLAQSAGAVALLVFAGIPLGMLIIGLPSAWLLDIPYSHGLLLGIAVAATDPASVGHVLNRFQIPERLKLLLHGESIFNDALTIVGFFALLGVIEGHVALSPGGVAVTAVRSMALAVPVGLLLGWLAGLLVRHWQEQNRIPGLTLTLILPFAGFLLSERLLHASGIIAVLCAALAFSHTRSAQKHPGRRELYDEFWEYLGSFGASLLYFALGAAMALQRLPLDWTLPAIILLLLLSRAALVHGAAPLLRTRGTALPREWRQVLLLGGLRGPVPAALVLMMPADYAYRDPLLAMVFIVVAYTVIVHPLLLRQYLNRHSVKALAESPDSAGPGLPPAMTRRLQACSWSLAAAAGMIAGVVFLILEMVMIPLFQGVSAWAPVRMIAAIGLGPDVLPPPMAPVADVILAALVVHFTLSLVYAWGLAPALEGLTPVKGLLLGTAFGLALYLVNFYLFTAVFPWFAAARNWITVFAHLVFGASLAWSYLRLKQRKHLDTVDGQGSV